MSKFESKTHHPLPNELSEISVQIAANRSLPLQEIIHGWSEHVRRLAADSASTPIRDGATWGADDYVAALTLRSFVQQAMESLPPDLRLRLQAWLAPIDASFRQFTVPDDDQLLTRWIHEAVPDQWWWNYIPADGCIVRELKSFGTTSPS